MTRTLVFEREDGSQVLVTVYGGELFGYEPITNTVQPSMSFDGLDVAERANQYGSWGPPLTLVRTETS